ncbi:MAG: DUF4434 domain-containing protein [Muribaculaceae bacterium]
MTKRNFLLSLLASLSLTAAVAADVLPVTGSWINLFYQDERNKYSNPMDMDNTDPDMWRAKVREMKALGIEYIVFMATANDGKADYPSKLMPLAYDARRESPVSAIIDEAAREGMKVFMSIGWAENQDDNLRNPVILNRQLAIMEELAHLYGNNEAFYGWYLPVEDCLGPVLSDAAVVAVNKLVDRAHKLTPGKKTLISPYGFYCCHFDDPQFARQIKRLKVDIIAYQDEVGCVREEFPMPRLKNAWREMKKIHDETNIEFWGNCELFSWEKGTNSRQSALVPAAMPRVISQLAAASEGGVSRIISFMTPGIWSLNADRYPLGQPEVSQRAAQEYLSWRNGDHTLKLLEASITGSLTSNSRAIASVKSSRGNASLLTDGITGDENPENSAWMQLEAGYNEITINLDKPATGSLFLRLLNCAKRGIGVPYKVYIYTADNANYRLEQIIDMAQHPNSLHDTWIEPLLLRWSTSAKSVKIGFQSTTPLLLDELYLR